MNKLLHEYRWFKFFSKNQIRIRAFGKNFYPTKRHVSSCKYCYFFENKLCILNIKLISDQPSTPCFPCKNTRYTGKSDEQQGEELLSNILFLCNKEDSFDKQNLNELIS